MPDVVIAPISDEAESSTPSSPSGGPMHTHSVTAAGLLAIFAGIGLIVAAPHVGDQGSLATTSGISLICLGAGGTSFGKSPAIP